MSKLKKIIIGASAAFAAVVIIICAIFITAGVSASKTSLSRDKVEALAIMCVYERDQIDVNRVIITDYDKDFHVGSKISNSYYTYDVEVNVDGAEYEVVVNSRTKTARIVDISKGR